MVRSPGVGSVRPARLSGLPRSWPASTRNSGWAALLLALLVVSSTFCLGQEGTIASDRERVRKTIFVYGDGMERVFLRYIIELTGKKRPKFCFLPTAAGDDHRVVGYIHRLCKDLPLEPSILMTFISSSSEQRSFEDQIMGSDAIVVGGGNTLNMLAIWKAQGIDTLLRRAYEEGIVLAGGSAGSLCWFTGGYTDSRPRELSLMTCLGFLNYSHSPHYNDGTPRKRLYGEAVLKGILQPGYACDDGAGLLFIDGELSESVTIDPESKNYHVYVEDGKLKEDPLPARLIK